jgi:hypothetical protein
VDGRPAQEWRLVAKKRISAGLEMGRLRVPHPEETVKGF